MALQTLFPTQRGKRIPQADARNFEQAPAYARTPQQTLAQYAATGCLSRTFYASAEDQLAKVLELCEALDPRYVAQVAIYSRTRGFLKDMPALLCAWLASRDARLHEAVFTRVIDSPRMLRTYIQILRSGVTGRRSLGTAPKRLVREWLASRSEEALFVGSAGQNPSLTDILKMVHPKPRDARREAFYGYLLGRTHRTEDLPELVRQYEKFRKGDSGELPDLPLPLLSSMPLDPDAWKAIALRAPWQTLRMNLNAFAKRRVFLDEEVAKQAAKRLCDREEIARAKVFPYQLLAAAYIMSGLPEILRTALLEAMEIATESVPQVAGRIVVCPDVSGSMFYPITGHRGAGSTAIRCVDVAGLVAAAFLRRNADGRILPFNEAVVPVELPAGGTVLETTQELGKLLGGGTSCSAPLAWLNKRDEQADLVVLISDNQSWADARRTPGTAVMAEWATFRQRNPGARLVCLDLQPDPTTQAPEREDILNIGGFSDHVFEVIADFASGRLEAGHWVSHIEEIAV